MRENRLRWVAGVLASGAVLSLVACAGDAATSDTSGPATIRVIGTNPLAAVAVGEDFFEGVNVEQVLVGTSDETTLFLSGEGDIAGMSPWTVAQLVDGGENLKIISTAGGIDMVNGVVVRAEDAGRYDGVEDLVGRRLGVPGLSSDTWLAFEALSRTVYDLNATEDFELVTAQSGALLALLEAGEVDAALLFSGHTATALALEDKFKRVFSFSEDWMVQTGQPLTITVPTVREEWLEQNEEAARLYIEGLDRAAAWVHENTDEFRAGGKYEETAELKGWLSDPVATDQIMKMIAAGTFLPDSSLYDQDWIDASYEFVLAAEGALLEKAPAKDDIFWSPID